MAQETSPTASPSNTFTPTDESVRQAIRQQLDETLFVEASAGTGKTSSLVERMVNLVATGRTTLDRIAAITFTEAAAAELRDRVRQRLEEVAVDESRPVEERELCRQGISDLDQAAVRTLHSFAAQLLHERPLEAGLPPGFDTSDEVVTGIRFDEEWKKWLDLVLERESPIAEHLSLAFSFNVTLENLRKLALDFHANYADLEGVDFTSTRPDVGAAARAVDELWPEVDRLSQFCKNEQDLLYNHIQNRKAHVLKLQEPQSSSLAYYRQLHRLPGFSFRNGSQRNWDSDPLSKNNACVTIRNLLPQLDEVVAEELEAAKGFALGQILNALSGFVLEYARHRKAEGRAEFHDLLVWARDMLRDRLDVREYFRFRFSHLLIDESQDTDPIQAEIAMFLAEAVPEGTPDEDRPRTWRQVLPETGKLFVVGDPKQSIYRFRRADVEQMRLLQERMEQAGGRNVHLVQNFRSQEPIISWVNHLFQQWMGSGSGEKQGRDAQDGQDGQEAYIQAAYDSMDYRWSGNAEGPFGPRVWALADEAMAGGVSGVRRQEAEDIASLLRQIVEQQWQKLDREATDATGQETFKPVGYSDICILIRSRTSLPELEHGLEAANIPYRLESASLIFETQEVRDLLNCLRAIDNPVDRIATVAALRSPAFACSDIDLLQYFERGGQFDYLAAPLRGECSIVGEALAVLKRFHEERLWESPAVLIERFMRDRQLLEAATTHPRMREQWRRYRFMVERAWQFAEAGGNSLRAFVGWIDDQISERVQVIETPVPESDEEAVRVMTIHAAKGLEFPVVILTGINSSSGSNNPPSSLYDRQRSAVEVNLGSGKNSFKTSGYDGLRAREDEMSVAERVRLMYVATTRARDHLVLSLRRPVSRFGANSAAAAMSTYLADRPELWQPVILQGAPPGADPDIVEDAGREDLANVPAEHSLEYRESWLGERQALIENLSRPAFTSATALGHPDSEEKPEQERDQTGEPWRRGRGATQVGRAVHAVLQSIDLATGEGLADRARAQATAEGIPEREVEVAELAQVAVNSEIVHRAVASGRLWREVPVAAPVGDGFLHGSLHGFLHGFIDLLFEEPDGLVVVDYKTDSVDAKETQEAVERYRLQGGAYAYAIGRATGKPVKEVLFLYLKPKREEALPDLKRATLEAEVRAKEQLGAGSA